MTSSSPSDDVVIVNIATEWHNRVQLIYDKSFAQANQENYNCLNDNYTKLQHEVVEISKGTDKLEEYDDLNLFDNDPCNRLVTPSARSTACYYSGSGKNRFAFTLPSNMLRRSQPVAKMYGWVSIPKNVYTDDKTRLSHLPYMGEKEDKEFFEELINQYKERLQQTQSKDHFLEDEQLIELVDALIPFAHENELKKGVGSSRALIKKENENKENHDIDDEDESGGNGDMHDDDFPPDVVFQAITAYFTALDSPVALKTQYCDLMKQKKKMKSIMEEKSSSFTPNIDDDNVAISTSSRNTLHSFTTLFCRRCYRYDCDLHIQDPAISPSKIRKKSANLLPLVSEPCSQICYLRTVKQETENQGGSVEHMDATVAVVDSADSSARQTCSANNNDSNDSKFTKPSFIDTWLPAEESLCRVLMGVFPKNPCAIARYLETKSCQQVLSFIQKESAPDEIDEKVDVVVNNNKVQPVVKKRKLSQWANHYNKIIMKKRAEYNGQVSNDHRYRPCDHPGLECSVENGCECVTLGNFCEKFCLCSPNCLNRFPGCNCAGKCIYKHCPCYLAIRECDPDLCVTCGANDFTSDPPRCQNVNIQRGLKQRLLIGISDVSGWGVFLKQPVEKNQFIAEYRGEVISQEEANRRGKVYDRKQSSFLFNLNSEFVIDATHRGNKIRFANHSIYPNCYGRTTLVNGDHRIGIYAKQSIKANEELFYDYSYNPTDRSRFVGMERERVKKRKDAKTTSS